MAKTDEELNIECMNRFIELANTMANEGVATHIVSASLMTGSAVYATFVAAGGNEGGLNPSGVDKVVAAYRRQLDRVQAAKQAQVEQQEAANKPD